MRPTVEAELLDEYVRAELAGEDPREAVETNTARLAVDASRVQVKDRATRRAHGQRGAGLPRLKWTRDNMTWTPRETGPERAARRADRAGLVVGAPVRAFIGQGRPRPNGNGHPGRPTPQGVLVPLERVDRLARYMLQRDVTTHVRHGVNWRPSARQRRRLDKKARQTSYRKLLESQRLDNPYPVTPESERLAAFWAQRPDTSVMVAAETLAALDTRGPAASAVIVDEPVSDAPVTVIEVPGLTEAVVSVDPAKDGPSAVVVAKPPRVGAWNEPARLGVAPPVMMENPPQRGFRVTDRRGEHRS